MTPEKFWDMFKTAYNDLWKTDTAKIRKAFSTDSMRSCQMIPLLVNMGINAKYHVETEAYPHIDVGYYSNCSEEWGKWSFEVVIEHENKGHPHWLEECSKLMRLNAGLKVLVSYRSEPDDDLRKELDAFPSIYQSRKYHQENDTYLFIFIPLDNFEETEKFSVYQFSSSSKDIKPVCQL
jgi:hypothetical protein